MGSLTKKEKTESPEKKREKIERSRNNRSVLIKRIYGGVGDILMTRPLLREVKRISASVVLHYAVPSVFAPLIVDLDEVDEIIPVETLIDGDEERYGWSGDISTACIKHETMFRSRVHEQRMDLWARHVQIELTQHHAQLRFTARECEDAFDAVQQSGCEPRSYMAVIPLSADKSRRLPDELIKAGCAWAREHRLQPLIVTEYPWDGPDIAPNVYGLDLRVWMALICQSSMFFGTDTGGLHVAGFAGVPGVAAFCHTSGRVVCKHYPSIIPVQLHRDDQGGMACCPCYDWGSCPWYKASGLPLKCMQDISADKLNQALDKAMGQEEGVRRYGVIDKINWSKIRTEAPSAIRANLPPADKHIGITMLCNESRPALAAVAGTIASMAKSMHRNSIFLVRMNGDGSELLHGHRYAKLCGGSVDEQSHSVEEWETHVLDGLLSGRKSLIKAVIDRFGIDLREASPCFYIDPASASVFETRYKDKQNFWFVSCSRNVICTGYERINDDPAWGWRTRAYAMSRAAAVITDDLDTAVVAALSRNGLVYLGENQYVLEKLPHVYICCQGVPCITKDTLKISHG